MANESNEIRAYTATVKDVMAHFNLSQNTVYNWLASSNPPPHRRVGGVYRFNLIELDEWTAGHGRPQAEPAREAV